ncbi:MAG: tRNA (adenosine(37)-N6)-dimethylallyltransferase MiaA [Chitinophagales bacterium]|nr:tRNA (adenosine(37)-N6)-dimethylallyltransferase MiaA [Chitinophagales bacterium]
MSAAEKHLIVVCGPTASGKTRLAITIAKHFNAEIFSADARQFYCEMNIGTAKPTAEELGEVQHHFINNLSIHDEYTAGKFEQEVMEQLEVYFQTKSVAVLCGGSGLFIRAVCEGLEDKTEIPETIRQAVRELSLEEMQAKLLELDPEFYASVDIQNPRRLTRALEVILSSGQKMSAQHTGAKKNRPFSTHIIGTELPRDILYHQINQRVDQMIAEGLEAEATSLYPFRTLQPLQTVGYREWFDFIEGKQSREKTIELIKQNTRHYAKRQITWFNKTEHLQWFNPNQAEGILSHLAKEIHSAI